MCFWQKYKMAVSHFVCERIFLVKKQKWSLLGRLSWSTKSGAISTKNGQVMAIFNFCHVQKLGIWRFFTIQNNFFQIGPEEPHEIFFDFFLPNSNKYCGWNMWWKFWPSTMSYGHFRGPKSQRADSALPRELPTSLPPRTNRVNDQCGQFKCDARMLYSFFKSSLF